MTPKRVRTVEGSCWLCKDRRVICDLQQPHCSRCVSKGLPCEYGEVRLRWCNGVAARGRFAGQNLPISVPRKGWKRKYKQEGSFEETESSEQHNYDEGSPDSQQLALVNCNNLPLGRIQSPVTVEHLMLYFENVVVDRFSLSTERVSINLASVYKEPALRHSVSAVANAHRVISLCSDRQDVFMAKKEARLKAIRNFRELLEEPNPLRMSKASALDLFMANVLLCILDGVIDPHDESAATYIHYRGGRAILGQLGLQKQLFQQKRGLPALMLSVFVTMDLTFSMLSGEMHYFQPETWASYSDCDGWWGVLQEGDPFLEIMYILSRLAQLGYLVRKGNDPTCAGFNEELGTLLIALRGHTLYDISYATEDDMSESKELLAGPLLALLDSSQRHLNPDQSWVVFCIAYRITGLIYTYRVFYGLDVSDPLVQDATRLGIQAICNSRLTGKLSHCLLFPALVIGSHCRTKEDQTAIVNTMNSTAAFLRFGSLRVMKNFLDQVWTQDLGMQTWWECFEPISKEAFLF
ncbi:fungal-specific transcription factor domain-containing protein [Talaromyces proteolyticus]|uniref:Fungal-specific transcription factor domain-containing protein n=1 Tax=Talaromyces proteolyticus TaxID=1131652 RepID=A0AAD4KKF5_9EURO|nr:fungal-specific transcription factor domain-containing protein [Talaromyces proteolyticus]KAH8693043.1 fungal-specific transcription factor domain-containing protein [Talaromyces proteolyticus]